MSKILIIEDNEGMRYGLIDMFKREGYSVTGNKSGKEALEVVKKEYFDLVITDMKIEDVDGIEVIRETKKISPSTEIILITAFGSIETAVMAIKEGAYDYITKPFEPEEIILAVERVLEKKKMADRIYMLEKELKDKYKFEGIIGNSPEILNVLRLVGKVSYSDSTILITGESGTGKELIAKAIHFNSPRQDKAIVILNCGAIPDNLHESELFGHKKGSFTSATYDKKGLFEEADGGSILLDEVGELSISAQVKLLRFLQNREIKRVGETMSKIVDVRIIAMTNRDLKEDLKTKRFREDLFFRLNVIPIHVPPLYKRRSDIKLLISYFIKRFSDKLNKTNVKISRRAISLLCNYKWPGNVRELENVIERAITLCENNAIVPSDLPEEINNEEVKILEKVSRKNPTLEDLEKEYILDTLERVSGNKKKASEMLGITRATLLNKLKKYNN